MVWICSNVRGQRHVALGEERCDNKACNWEAATDSRAEDIGLGFDQQPNGEVVRVWSLWGGVVMMTRSWGLDQRTAFSPEYTA